MRTTPDLPSPGPSAASLGESLLRVWDELPEAIVALDPEWRYRYLNAAALGLLGLTQDVVGVDSRDVHPEAASSAFGAAYQRVMSSRVIEAVEHHYQPLDTYLAARIVPWPDGGLVIVLRDVTEERRLRARLQRDLDLYQQILDQTTQALSLRDLDSRFVFVNQAAAARLGRPVEELVGLLSGEVLPREVDEEVRATDLLVRQTGLPQDNVGSHRLHADRTVVSQSFPVRDSDGTLIGFGTAVTDLTELAAAQSDLAASEHRYRKVFGSTSLGIVVLRSNGAIVEANSALCRLLGYSRTALLEMTGLDLVGASSANLDQRLLRLGTEAPGGYETEEEFIRSDGQVVPVLLTVNSFDDPAGRGRLFSCVVRDLTPLHLLQAQLVAAERMEAVGQLAAGIAHDSNNILAAVSGYAEMLAGEVEGQPAAERHLAGIERSVQRAGDMVGQLLAFTRGQTMEPAQVDLVEMVQDLADMLQQLLPTGTRLEVDPQPANAWADASQIRQVLLNLVVNARDALNGTGTIRITTRRDQAQTVSLSVTDDGPGMPSDVARRCFEPFFTTRQGSGGTGVGLSTAHAIARQSGGDLRVTTVLGEGTRFELVLPAAELPAADTAPRAPTTASDDVTIVVADDDPEMLELMVSTLETAGYQVAAAENGVEALAAAARASLVVSDIEMPAMTGLELAERLRIQQPQLPVLLVSGATSPQLDAPIPFLAKPFTRAALLGAVEAALTEEP